MAFACDFCGTEVEEPGEAFVEHLKASAECRVKWEHEADALKDEWSRH